LLHELTLRLFERNPAGANEVQAELKRVLPDPAYRLIFPEPPARD
jgi:hypothetical protein